MRNRSTVAVLTWICVVALAACGGDDAAAGSGGTSSAGTGGDGGTAGMAGDGGTGGDSGTGGTGGDSGTGGTGGDSGMGGTGGDSGEGGTGGEPDAGMMDPDSGVDAMMPVECPLREQDNDGDGICSLDCLNFGCTNGTCDDATGTAICTCEALYEGEHCETLSPPPQEGLVGWFDAQDADTLELVGAGVTKRVARWESVLDENVAFVQDAVTGQPGLRTTGINGRPAAEFDGNSDFLALEDFDGLKNALSYDIYFVATSTNDTESGALLAGVNGEDGTAGVGLHGLLIEANDMASAWRFNHRMPFAASGGVDLTTSTDQDLTSTLPYRFAANSSNGRLVIQRDGTQIGTTTGNVIAFNRDLDLTLGRLSGTQDLRRFKGRVGEILIYNASQNSVASARIRSYLKAHWPAIL